MKNMLHVVKSVIAESLKLLGDKRAGCIPAGPDDVDSRWLTDILEESYPGTSVASVWSSGETRGTTSRACIQVEYDEGGNPESITEQFFVKMPSSHFATRLFTNMVRLGPNEVNFYNTISQIPDIDIPQVYYARCAGSSQRFVLLLENVGSRGADFIDITHHFSLKEARQVIGMLASLHAPFWGRNSLSTEYQWMKDPGNNPRAGLESLLCSLALGPALKRYRGLMPDEVSSSAKHIMNSRAKLDRIWARGPLTVIHGDAHAGNMYLADGSVGLLDWQAVQMGQGMRDVSYFIILSLDAEFRRKHQDELLDCYIKELHARGVDITLDEALEQYCIHALYAWIAAAVTAAAATFQMEHIAALGLSRASQAVCDLNSVELLNSFDI